MKKIIEIEGMNCGHCAARIEKALGALSGVSSVKVDLVKKTAEVETAQALTEADVKAAVDAAGYQVVKLS